MSDLSQSEQPKIEQESDLGKALVERNLWYVGDVPAGFIMGWEAQNARVAELERQLAASRYEAVERLGRRLAAVDQALPPWEPAPGEFAVGRVQTILNLVSDRERLEASRSPEAVERLREALGRIVEEGNPQAKEIARAALDATSEKEKR